MHIIIYINNCHFFFQTDNEEFWETPWMRFGYKTYLGPTEFQLVLSIRTFHIQ